jgi:hypothetical protein
MNIYSSLRKQPMSTDRIAGSNGHRGRAVVLVLLLAAFSFAQKQVYEPSFLAREGSNLKDCNTPFCSERSVQTDNWIIYWQKGFGADPSTSSGSYKVNMTALKEVAEKSYAVYVDSLKMVLKGSSLTDKYKMMIFLLYQTDWAAFGSGQDEKVGTLHVNPAAANINTVLAHEIGHCFEYMTGADVPGSGWRWGFGTNGDGGNGFWEQIANWQAFKTYPAQQFTAGDFGSTSPATTCTSSTKPLVTPTISSATTGRSSAARTSWANSGAPPNARKIRSRPTSG